MDINIYKCIYKLIRPQWKLILKIYIANINQIYIMENKCCAGEIGELNLGTLYSGMQLSNFISVHHFCL